MREKLSFASDYTQGAHPAVLDALLRQNGESLPGYGTDKYTERAAGKIRSACNAPEARVFLLTGGTQTNATVIAASLAPYEGVVAAETGHISVHEAGAVEHTGHKVLTLPAREGKLDPAAVERYIEGFYADGNHEHMVFPGMVYISQPTEYGTLYTKRELTALSALCRKWKLPLFLDGARLGYALAAEGTDVTLPDIAALCDVFYIGGTKVGALCGEAVVFPRGNAPKQFLTMVKQNGALLAKGFVLGAQFDALFTEGLYFEISRNAIDRAAELKEAFRSRGYRFFLDSPTNQQFLVLENGVMGRLAERVEFSLWEKYDEGHTVVRFATGWMTAREDVAALERILDELQAQ